jgi:mono/diheme cytochrome c family protein
MIWLKRLAYVVIAFLVLIAGALATVWVITSLRIGKTYHVPARPVVVPTDSVGVARGRHIVAAIGKCTECHGEDLGGQVVSDDFLFGRLAAPNLTRGQGGLGTRYDDPTLVRAIRHAIDERGKPLLVMPSEAFQYLSDDDVGAVVGYLRALPPVDRQFPSRRVGPLARVLSLLTDFPLIPARVVDHDRQPPRTVVEDSTAEYGKYLAEAGGCTGCHRPDLSGGSMGPGGKPASNLTPTGIGTWTEADFFKALRQGVRPGGTPIDSAMPWKRAGLMSDTEIHAVWLYLKSVPPREFNARGAGSVER